MSDPIKHECGVVFLRLRKPLEYYQEKYGSALYGIRKLQLIMAKQLNRGQDGAGIGVVKLDPDFGRRYIARKRNNDKNAVANIFESVLDSYKNLDEAKVNDTEWLKANFEASKEELFEANKANLPLIRSMLEDVAADAAVLHMEKEDLIEDFLIAYNEALSEIGFSSRDIARMAAAALAL